MSARVKCVMHATSVWWNYDKKNWIKWLKMMNFCIIHDDQSRDCSLFSWINSMTLSRAVHRQYSNIQNGHWHTESFDGNNLMKHKLWNQIFQFLWRKKNMTNDYMGWSYISSKSFLNELESSIQSFILLAIIKAEKKYRKSNM